MYALIQRVSSAKVVVDDNITGQINQGLLALIGIEKTDDTQTIERMTKRLLNYRIFSDDAGHMNLNIEQISGGLLLVPQFTLVADTQKGNRPSFSSACPPEAAEPLFNQLVETMKTQYTAIETGVFSAHMHVHLVNDGPVTFMLKA